MAIVLISDPHMPRKPSTSMLRQLHGLTYAEADVLARMTVGSRLDEIAKELGISVQTVRTHLKAIFTKTGTSRQAELVRHAVLSGVLLQVADGESESRLVAMAGGGARVGPTRQIERKTIRRGIE
jgi:DNA-binding CsgD family transcriptional regulator